MSVVVDASLSMRKYPCGDILPVRGMYGAPSAAYNTHPDRDMALSVVLYSSIHSSELRDEDVPAQATSLMTTGCVDTDTVCPADEVLPWISRAVTVKVYDALSAGRMYGVVVAAEEREGNPIHDDPPLLHDTRYDSRSSAVLDHERVTDVVAIMHDPDTRDDAHAGMVRVMEGGVVSAGGDETPDERDCRTISSETLPCETAGVLVSVGDGGGLPTEVCVAPEDDSGDDDTGGGGASGGDTGATGLFGTGGI
jgi:hypothetical protein